MDTRQAPDKPSELSELAATINELAKSGVSVDDAIEAAEHNLKVLRSVKKMLDVDKEPAPRTTAKKKNQPAASAA